MTAFNSIAPILLCTGLLTTGISPRTLSAQDATARSVVDSLGEDFQNVSLNGSKLTFEFTQRAINNKRAVMPRLCAPIKSLRWRDAEDRLLKFVPEPDEWVFSWKATPENSVAVEMVFDRPPLMPEDCPPASPSGDGSVMLHAFQAQTFGEKLRFEPQWYKNTVGYWTVKDDYATWTLSIDQPGEYSVALLQGCGKGQGGSDASISLLGPDGSRAELSFQTLETAHFQNFRWNDVGTVAIAKAGSFELRLEAKRIAKNALFDVRMIHLVRQAKSPE